MAAVMDDDDDMEIDVEGVARVLENLDIDAHGYAETVFMYADGVYNKRESAMANYIKHAGIEDKAVVFLSTRLQRDRFERCAKQIGLNTDHIVFGAPERWRGINLKENSVFVVAHPTEDFPKIDEMMSALETYAYSPGHWYQLRVVFPKPYETQYKTPKTEPFQVNYVETISRESRKQKSRQTYKSLFDSTLKIYKSDQINYLKGDVTRFGSLHGRLPILIHCCNNRKRIGAGVSGAIIRAFPGVKDAYLSGSSELGSITMFTANSGRVVCNIIGQDGYGRDGKCYVRYVALSKGMKELVERFSGKAIEIHCPRLGCGLAGGDWTEISALLEENFLVKGIPVTVYDLE